MRRPKWQLKIRDEWGIWRYVTCDFCAQRLIFPSAKQAAEEAHRRNSVNQVSLPYKCVRVD